ncbi:MAG: peptidoglycan-associated lipoprotein Pal [Gammaproteobacteria bacterium]|nr:peptidoglycan-associated lipoprotein Pal [Gammaproteobacteria bacterium]
MKLITLVTALVLSLSMAACTTTKTNTGSGTEGTGSGIDANAASQMSAAEAQAEELRRLREQGKIVYFDFDSNVIRPEYNEILANHGQFLAQHPEQKIVINGHTDERGSPEYNIGLGERRAKAVATILMSHGVQPSQIETVSYGEERPADAGHSEESWAQNRRAELMY